MNSCCYKEQLVGLKKFLDKLPWTLQIVLKSMIRSRSKSKTAIICLTLCIFLMTVSLAGGAVAWWTTRSYVDNSFGQNVIAIGHEKILTEYEAMMTDALNTNLSTFNFLENPFFIDEEFLEKLNTIQQITIIDNRLLMIDKVVEVQTRELVNDNGDSHYVTYGRSNVRSSTALIVGVNPHSIADNLLTQNMPLNSNTTTTTTTIVGSSLAQNIFDNPLKQKIALDSYNSSSREFFSISDIALDPINQGFVVYIPLNTLQELKSLPTQNLILIKVQNTDDISKIENLAAQYNLNTLPLNRVHQLSLSNIDTIWLSILPFPILSTVTTLIGLLNCLLVSFSGRHRDFGILQAMGAKNNYITKIILLESFTFILPTAIIGITLGMIFNFVFLLPNATISLQLLFTCLGGLALLLFSICLISAIITLKLNKHSPTNLIQNAK
ncbi:MAG: ABC transporter permease [Candidatus Bathyarchaeota archaeon]|nr:ABC transporter permease [Candidatus Termiticorpusculum sp.]